MTREHSLENIRRSCLNCGEKHYSHDICCDDPFCVSDLQKENEILKLEKEKMLVDFSIPENNCSYLKKIGGLTEHRAEFCNKCLLVKKSLELEVELKTLIE